MDEEVPFESESQFMDIFMTMWAMVEEMYQEFKMGRGKSTSTTKQDQGVEEPSLDALEGKGKGEKIPPSSPPPSPPSTSSPSPEKKKKKTSLIKLDVKFNLPIYDGELNAEKIDN